ncbi:type VI secretion system tip protein VgrG [Rugamonas sp. FT107W]|uniref:Type VI secretion system tip protein VgrG n=1 Tax=Duganella vulcania TaxID=2692166 RepID=A0A845HMW2_9BURK|nr:type VI secretion system tip protein TssI/VgrG [Duganella vulcania]MYN20131.1 type VI secretion system tip protein VgrG [Duganella vulcania]
MSSLSEMISAFAHGRQNNRILRLSFPHDDGPHSTLLANRLEASEGLSRDFEYTVEVLADDASLALKDVQGKMVTISLVRGDGSMRFFNGYVFEFRLVKTDGSVAFYSMVLRPWLAYLKLRKDNYLFHGKSLRDQSADVFSDYGTHPDWDCQVMGADEPVTMACQFDETDHNYLHRRWEAAGWHYWYEHSEKAHKLILADDSTQAAPIDGDGPEIRFQRHAGAIEEDAIGDWSPVRSIVASKVAISAFDFKHPLPNNVDLPTLNQQGDVLTTERYEYAGAYGVKGRKDAEALALLRMEEIESRGKHIEAGGNCRFAMPGRWFRLTDHFHEGSPDKQEYVLVSVHHSATNNYLQLGDAATEYSNKLTCIRKNVHWRPGRGFNSVETKIHGPQTAVVAGPSGQEIHSDEHGRVRVQFHWDRVGLHDEQSSAWVRVASSWAGGNFGAISLPRIGQEVIVQWLDSNPDRPIITGRVYNGENMAPWELPRQHALSGIRSSELKGAGGAGGRNNHLLMDDTAGQIQAVLSSDHYRSQLSLGYLTRVLDTSGRQDHRGEGYELRTDGWGSLRAAKGILVTAWAQPVQDQGTTQQDNTEGADTLRAVLDSAEMRSQAAEMATEQRGEIKNSHRGLKNQKLLSENSWSLTKPLVFISAPEGIAASTPKSIVHAAGEDLGCYAAGNVDMTSGESMSFSSAKGIQQHVERGGMVTAISHGNHYLHVQDGKSETISQTGMVFEAKSGDIVLKTKGGSIVLTEKGEILIKGANETHDIAGTIKLGAKQVVNKGSVPAAPVTEFWGKMNVGKFSQQVVLANALHMVDGVAANYAYKILAKDGSVLKAGKLDADGKTERVFTEDMEELHVEIDRNNGKWQFIEDVKHDPYMDEDEDDHELAEQVKLPVGVGVLATQTEMPVDMAKSLFMPDGEINIRTEAMGFLSRKLHMPVESIVHILKNAHSPKGALADLGKEKVYAVLQHEADNLVEKKVNASAARLVAMVSKGWRGNDDMPRDVTALFEEAAFKRVRDIASVAEAAAKNDCFGVDEDTHLLSMHEDEPLELDGPPSDMRHDGNDLPSTPSTYET